MDEHIIEAMGKAKVLIRDGRVIEVSEPKIDYCPLFHKRRGIEKITPEIIKENMEFRIADFGMCSSDRVIEMKDFLSFGISEILSTLLEDEIIDCAVMVCEGCGTVLITKPKIAQGVGGRVSGLVKTSPIPEIMEKIGNENVFDTVNAKIDQIAGVKMAMDKGYGNIAVTIANGVDGKNLRKLEKENPNLNIYIFAVHTTGMDRDEAKEIYKYCDVITSCASKAIRDEGKKALISVGNSIPIFAASEKGKEFIELRLKKIGKENKLAIPNPPKPLI
ncbi:MAG: DUF2099 family protein [Methanobrevibacter sp.]|jgi:putative methanogenesis marker protein 8|nr:DUF2099 family protein [Candidatus Methanoflexus mossambicus]